MNTYHVRSITYELLRVGIRAGTRSIVVRLASQSDAPFSARELLAHIIRQARQHANCPNVLFVPNGSEASHQIGADLVSDLRSHEGLHVSCLTRGLHQLASAPWDWLTVSPHDADQPIAEPSCDELRYLISAGDPLPTSPRRHAAHQLVISPQPIDDGCYPDDLAHCYALTEQHPQWRVAVPYPVLAPVTT